MSKRFKNRLKQFDFKDFSLSDLVRVAYFLPSAIANLEKSGTFASTVPALLPIRTACGSFDKKTYSVNNNTPPGLTSVAHLGGFSFLWGL